MSTEDITAIKLLLPLQNALLKCMGGLGPGDEGALRLGHLGVNEGDISFTRDGLQIEVRVKIKRIEKEQG